MIIIFVGIAIIGFILYLILYMPLVRQLKVKSNETKAQEAELLKARNIVTSMKTTGSKAQLVTEDNLSIAIDELTKRGKLHNINFVSVKLGELIRETVYAILPIEMVLESGYLELGGFLGSLDELQKSVVKVNEFEVLPQASEPSKLNTRLMLNMYILR